MAHDFCWCKSVQYEKQWTCFYHLTTKLFFSSYQLDAHFLYSIIYIYICYIIILNICRAVPCLSSGGQIVLLQPVVSSLSVNGRTVRQLRADCNSINLRPSLTISSWLSATTSTLTGPFIIEHISLTKPSYTFCYQRRIGRYSINKLFYNSLISSKLTLSRKISTFTCSPLSTGVLYGRLQTVTIPETVIIKSVLLKMSKVLLETC